MIFPFSPNFQVFVESSSPSKIKKRSESGLNAY